MSTPNRTEAEVAAMKATLEALPESIAYEAAGKLADELGTDESYEAFMVAKAAWEKACERALQNF